MSGWPLLPPARTRRLPAQPADVFGALLPDKQLRKRTGLITAQYGRYGTNSTAAVAVLGNARPATAVETLCLQVCCPIALCGSPLRGTKKTRPRLLRRPFLFP